MEDAVPRWNTDYSNSFTATHSRNRFLDQVYDDYRDISDRTIDSHIRNLRQKLKVV